MQFVMNGQIIDIPVGRVVNAGFAGHDQAAVKAHIDELAVIGVAVPRRVPTFYPVPVLQLTQADIVQVGHGQTSAEVEYVLFFSGGKRYLTVGSDHSDRALEAHSVNAAKQICPNIVAAEVWDFDAICGHLNQLILKCEIADTTGWRVYQESPITVLLPPEQLLELGRPVIPENKESLVLFSGTIPTIGEITYATHWRVSLTDLTNGKCISKDYEVEILPDCID